MARKAATSTDEFIKAWQGCEGRASVVAERLGYSSLAGVCNRRAYIEKQRGITLTASAPNSQRHAALHKDGGRRIELEIQDGTIVVGSDAHVWPGPLTTAQRGFIALIKRLKPAVVIMNGDVFDGARVSRFPAGLWMQEDRPKVQQELEACQNFLTQVQKAAGTARLIWTFGNHDARFEMRLAALNPEYKGVKGFALADHFPAWSFCMAVFVNGRHCIKHRMNGGVGAKRQNTIKAGMHTTTGHLHSLGCQENTNYTGTWYGTDSGTLAEPDSRQFDYIEEGPKDWRSGNAVHTYTERRLMRPEFVQVWDENRVEFRGEIITV